MDCSLKNVMTTSPWPHWLESNTEAWLERGLERNLRAFGPISPVRGRSEGKDYVLFSTNDYLGLSFHPSVRETVARAVRDYGMGARGSALVCGYSTAHERLEASLASLKRAESALLFPTGFAANLAVLQSLADPETAIFSDELNHASIVDGCRLAKGSGARVEVYRHCDPDHLEHLLSRGQGGRKLIVTDSVFSMDGDLAPLAEIADLKETYGAILAVDEAHATLVFGPRGGGLAEQLGVEERVDLHIGTLSKAFGQQGGFVACSQEWRNWLLNRARPYVFSTALPVPLVAGASAALEVCEREPSLKKRLWDSIGLFSKELNLPGRSPIFPIRLGNNETALKVSDLLLENGFHVPAIRPPSVPEGTARLRVALSAAHTREDLQRLSEALANAQARGYETSIRIKPQSVSADFP